MFLLRRDLNQRRTPRLLKDLMLRAVAQCRRIQSLPLFAQEQTSNPWKVYPFMRKFFHFRKRSTFPLHKGSTFPLRKTVPLLQTTLTSSPRKFTFHPRKLIPVPESIFGHTSSRIRDYGSPCSRITIYSDFIVRRLLTQTTYGHRYRR